MPGRARAVVTRRRGPRSSRGATARPPTRRSAHVPARGDERGVEALAAVECGRRWRRRRPGRAPCGDSIGERGVRREPCVGRLRERPSYDGVDGGGQLRHGSWSLSAAARREKGAHQRGLARSGASGAAPARHSCSTQPSEYWSARPSSTHALELLGRGVVERADEPAGELSSTVRVVRPKSDRYTGSTAPVGACGARAERSPASHRGARGPWRVRDIEAAATWRDDGDRHGARERADLVETAAQVGLRDAQFPTRSTRTVGTVASLVAPSATRRLHVAVRTPWSAPVRRRHARRAHCRSRCRVSGGGHDPTSEPAACRRTRNVGSLRGDRPGRGRVRRRRPPLGAERSAGVGRRFHSAPAARRSCSPTPGRRGCCSARTSSARRSTPARRRSCRPASRPSLSATIPSSVTLIGIEAGSGADSFAPGAGRRDVELVRDVLAGGESLGPRRGRVGGRARQRRVGAAGRRGDVLRPGPRVVVGAGALDITNAGPDPATVAVAVVGDPVDAARTTAHDDHGRQRHRPPPRPPPPRRPPRPARARRRPPSTRRSTPTVTGSTTSTRSPSAPTSTTPTPTATGSGTATRPASRTPIR